MAENVTQTELDKLNSTAKTAAASSDETKTYEGKFIGTLIGQATTAQELAKPYNFTLSGDVTGSASVNAGDLIMPVTVNHSAHADTSDFAGKTQLANRSNVADMANTAEFAYRAGKIAKIIINLTGVVTGKGESTNSESVDIEVTDFDASKQFVVGALATEPDTSKVYIDVAGKHLWIYDNTGAVWVDCFKQLADELDSHNLRIEALERFNLNERVTNLEGQTSTLEEITADHESRITANKKVIDNYEIRLNNIETTTDLGQVTLRITAIEEKNKQQDTSLEANATAIAKETSDREQAITTEAKAREDADNALGVRIDNADAKNTEQDTHLGTIDTHLETIDTHLGTIDDKNTEQDTALDTAKNELNASIGALSQKLQANYLDKTSEQEIATGVKTFSGGSDVNVFVVKGDFDLTQAPAKTCYSTIPFLDKNNTLYAFLQASYNSKEERLIGIQAVSHDKVYGAVGVYVTKDNKAVTFASTPSPNAVSSEIVTSEWMFNRLANYQLDYTAGINFTSTANSLIYTAPTNGMIWIRVTGGTQGYVDGFELNGIGAPSPTQVRTGEYWDVLHIPVKKGDTMAIHGSTGPQWNWCMFYPYKNFI